MVVDHLADIDPLWVGFPEDRMRGSSVFFKYIYNKVYYSVHPRNKDNS